MKKSLRILLLLPMSPVPFGGAAARWFYVLIKGLVEQNHNLTVFVACNQPEEIDTVSNLFPKPQYDLRCYLVPKQARGILSKIETFQRPYSHVFSSKLKKDLAVELAKPYDVLHCEDLWTGWLGLKQREKTVVNVLYLFSIDKTFERKKSWEMRLREFMTNRAEKKLLKAFPKIITLSDSLAGHIRRINPNATIYTVPLGIDLSFYPFAEQKPVNLQPTVGLIGSFNWTPSYSAAERLLTRLWPEIKRRVPNAKLQIVGRSARDSLATFVNTKDVEIYQDVPDILPYFSSLDVLLYAPVAGSGMKVKIMEAFALGIPVVTNASGVEGLPAKDGIHASICEDDQGLIDKTVELLENKALQRERRLRARQLLEKHCSPQATVSQIEQIYQSVIE
jgi:glycosyltransferase involved in cell wall biosynthesis